MTDKKKYKVNEVFLTAGLPKYTYVEREGGKFENNLVQGLNNGKICLITGPSQTGKSTLYENVLKKLNKIPLTINCDISFDDSEFWKNALEDVKFDRIVEECNEKQIALSAGIKASIEAGWNWVAKALGEVSLGLSGSETETEVREKVLSKPSYKHLLPILKELPYVLVIEDVHYLRENIQKIIFQQWKKFHSQKIPVIIVGTTIHSIDLVKINRDLRGRTIHCDVTAWKKEDLKSIIKKGFDTLGIVYNDNHANYISEESIGMPSLTQEICFRLLLNKGYIEIDKKRDKEISFNKIDINNAYYDIAESSYSSIYKQQLSILQSGIRYGKNQKYGTYKLLVSIFRLDPITNCLNRNAITERIDKILRENKLKRIPPSSSVTKSLRNLDKLQQNFDIKLLEWNEINKLLYIIEPTFLFYLRWYTKRENQLSQYEFMLDFLEGSAGKLGIYESE